VTVIKSSVFPVLKQFPGRTGDIKKLYKQSQAFQTVCDDYRLCADALRHWKHSHEKEAAARRQEYEQLFRELRDEICLYLNEG
jgi:hypothetical protein